VRWRTNGCVRYRPDAGAAGAHSSADGGIASVQKNSADDACYDRTSSAGKFHFNLKAPNHQVIGTSQLYATADSRDAGIASVKDNGKSTTIKYST
jgi:uncharacterized protein